MNKILYSGITAVLLASCAPQQQTNQFCLKGSINETDGQEIYLCYTQNDSIQIQDTLYISGGKFEAKGTVEIPAQKALLYMGSMQDRNNKRYAHFYLEPKAMTVAIDTAYFTRPQVTGSFTQAQMDTLEASAATYKKEIEEIYKRMRAETDPIKASEIREQTGPLQEKIRELQIAFVKSHPNSLIGPDLMRFLISKMTYAEIKEIYDAFGENVKKYGGENLKEIEKELAVLARVQPGAPAPEIKKEDVNGKEVVLSSLKGKVVLLDFWASWCVPCRKSFPHVKALYDKYHDKGFEVFCVASDDGKEDKWREAIKKDGLEKFYHVLRGFHMYRDEKGNIHREYDNDVSELYAVHFLPTKYLIDREGKIIGKMDDERLDAKLKEIFGF